MTGSRIQWVCGVLAAFMAVAASADPPTFKFGNRYYGHSASAHPNRVTIEVTLDTAAPGCYQYGDLHTDPQWIFNHRSNGADEFL